MGIDKYIAEGYYVPTTYNALTNIHRDEMATCKRAAYRPLIYICSPYAGDTVRNVLNARKYSRFAYEQNTIPIAKKRRQKIRYFSEECKEAAQ